MEAAQMHLITAARNVYAMWSSGCLMELGAWRTWTWLTRMSHQQVEEL